MSNPNTSHAQTQLSVAEILQQLIAIPSVNPMGQPVTGDIYYEHRLSDWLIEYCKSAGLTCERIPVAENRDNVLVYYAAGHNRPTILLDAHQDTVPIGGMTIAPFGGEVRANRIYGRGACDVKGGMAAMLFAITRLAIEQPAAAANVILSCTCDEESGILGITELVQYWNEKKGLSQRLQTAPTVAIVAEPTDLNVVIAHRGVIRFRLRTVGRACHSSNPTQGINAIYRMGHILQALEEYAVLLPQVFPVHPLCGAAAISVGRIQGGISVNIVPDECVIEIDRRIVPGEDESQILPHLRNFLQHHVDFPVELETPWLHSPALKDDANQSLANRLLAVIGEQTGQPEQFAAVGVPYGTHASLLAAGGVPAVVFGPGSIEQAHTVDESINLTELQQAAEIYFQFCKSGYSTDL